MALGAHFLLSALDQINAWGVFTHRALLNDDRHLCLGIDPGAVHGLRATDLLVQRVPRVSCRNRLAADVSLLLFQA